MTKPSALQGPSLTLPADGIIQYFYLMEILDHAVSSKADSKLPLG